METEHIYLLITKQLNGELSEKEHEALENWIKESGKNQDLVKEFGKIWELGGAMAVDLDTDTKNGWEKVEQRVKTSTKQMSGWATFFKIAASVIAFISLGSLFYLLTVVEEIKYQTGNNENRLLVLPDSTKVWMNENSMIAYNHDFNDERTLNLTGEAFFEVTKNTSRPFRVESKSLVTTVLGTSFSVIDKLDNAVSKVIVSTGRVMVHTRKDTLNQVMLEPGTKVSFAEDSQRLVKSSNTDINYLAWKDGKLTFRNTTLDHMEKILEGYFEVNISIDQEFLTKCRFTGDFQDPTIEEILEVLSFTLDISYVKDGKDYQLAGKGCGGSNIQSTP